MYRRSGARFNRGRIATAVASTINVAQTFGVESTPATLGVIAVGQALAVEGTGTTGADITTLPGVVGVWDDTAVVTTSVASLTSGADLTNAAWTKTNCTATATGNGTQASIAATGATTPLVAQAVTNAQFNASLMVPATFTGWCKYVDTQYIVFQARASTTVNRVWIDVQNGAIGTVDSGATASIQAETRNGQAGYRWTVIVTGCGAALTSRFQASSTDGGVITAPGVGKAVIVDDFTVSQIRASAWTDRVSGYTLDQVTVANQPEYGTDANGPFLRCYGNHYMISTGANVVAAFAGTSHEYSLHVAAAFGSVPVLQAAFSACTAAQVTNGARFWGQSTTGSGRWRAAAASDSGTLSNVDSAATAVTGAHIQEWYTSSAGGQVNMQLDGAAADPSAAAQAPGAISCDRVGIGGRVGSSPNTLLVGKIYAVVVTSGAPDTAQNGVISQALGTQFGITVAP